MKIDTLTCILKESRKPNSCTFLTEKYKAELVIIVII